MYGLYIWGVCWVLKEVRWASERGLHEVYFTTKTRFPVTANIRSTGNFNYI